VSRRTPSLVGVGAGGSFAVSRRASDDVADAVSNETELRYQGWISQSVNVRTTAFFG
jgi:hypothetical protein